MDYVMNRLSYQKEQRWEQRFFINGEEKVVYPKSEEQKAHNLEVAKKLGYRFVSCKKLYPFSMEKNQHNFSLISDICSNRIYDLQMEKKVDWAEVERLQKVKAKADKYFGYPLPVAWVSWEELREMRSLAADAVEHRANACVEAGRPDLVKYC